MAQTVLVLNHPIVKFADTEAGLTTGAAYECQINSAVVAATPNLTTVPSTGCSGPRQSAGLTSYTLNVTFLQDWPAPEAEALSWWSFAHDGQTAWFEYTPDADNPTVKMTGEIIVHASDFGGTFGDGSAAQATVSWPLTGRPTVVPPVAGAAATAGEELDEAA